MPRTTDIQVGLLLDPDFDPTLDISPFIETASMVVDRVVATAKDDDGSEYYNDVQLEMIERWLAAHFVSVRDPAVVFEGAGKVQQSFESKVGFHFDNTRFGQAAMTLDMAGGLAELQAQMSKGGKIKPLVVWLGKEKGEE